MFPISSKLVNHNGSSDNLHPDSIILKFLNESGEGEMLRLDVFLGILTRSSYNPSDKSCFRTVTLAAADIQVSIDHLGKPSSKKKVNFLCSAEAVSANQEWLKLLQRALQKLKEIASATSTMRQDAKDEKKACVHSNFGA